MTSIAIYQKVASGELTPGQGADLLMPPKREFFRQPKWMPRWAFVVLFVLAYAVLAPIVGNTQNRSPSA